MNWLGSKKIVADTTLVIQRSSRNSTICRWFSLLRLISGRYPSKTFHPILRKWANGKLIRDFEAMPCRNLQSCWLRETEFSGRVWLLEVKSKPHKISSFCTLYDWRLSQTCMHTGSSRKKTRLLVNHPTSIRLQVSTYFCVHVYMQCDGNAMQFIVMFCFIILFLCYSYDVWFWFFGVNPPKCYSLGIIIPNTDCCLYLYVH